MCLDSRCADSVKGMHESLQGQKKLLQMKDGFVRSRMTAKVQLQSVQESLPDRMWNLECMIIPSHMYNASKPAKYTPRGGASTVFMNNELPVVMWMRFPLL